MARSRTDVERPDLLSDAWAYGACWRSPTPPGPSRNRCEELLATWVFPEEFNHVGLSYFLPRILTVGDLPHLAAGGAPRPLLLVNGVDGQRRLLEDRAGQVSFAFTETIYSLHGSPERLSRRYVDSATITDLLLAWLQKSW